MSKTTPTALPRSSRAHLECPPRSRAPCSTQAHGDRPWDFPGGKRSLEALIRAAIQIRRIFCTPATSADYALLSPCVRRYGYGLPSVACAMRASRAICYGSRRGDMSHLSRSWNGSLVPRLLSAIGENGEMYA